MALNVASTEPEEDQVRSIRIHILLRDATFRTGAAHEVQINRLTRARWRTAGEANGRPDDACDVGAVAVVAGFGAGAGAVIRGRFCWRTRAALVGCTTGAAAAAPSFKFPAPRPRCE